MNKNPISVMIIEDDPLFVQAMTLGFAQAEKRPTDPELKLSCFAHPKAALHALETLRPEVIVLDIHFEGRPEGLDALPLFLSRAPGTSVLVHSVADDHGTVVRAMRQGAYDYVPKNAGASQLRAQILAVAAQRRQLTQAGGDNDHALRATTLPRFGMTGDSAPMLQLREQISKISASQGSVIVEGESGVGKELVARALVPPHAPFVPVDAATLDGPLSASLLFGHEKGAFTGADRQSTGFIEQAHGGVLFIDEIANMTPEVQAKLLRVLQEREICRVGGVTRRPVNFRLVCATHASLPALCESGQFRFDLYMRLKVFHLRVPPLRERAEDVVPLFYEFWQRFHPQHQALAALSSEVQQALTTFDWPGNVRQLAHAAQYAVAMATSDTQLGLEALPAELGAAGTGTKRAASEAPCASAFHAQMRAFEYNVLFAAYAQAGGNISAMARTLELDRSTLHARLRLHGIHQPRNT